MRKNIINSIFGIVVVIGIKVGYSLFFTSAAIEGASMAGMGWDDAKEELLASYTSEINSSEELKEFPAESKEKYANCLANRSIEFLNSTDCKYLYNKLTTSVEEHTAEQDRCIEASGYLQAIEEQIVPGCINQILSPEKLETAVAKESN